MNRLLFITITTLGIGINTFNAINSLLKETPNVIGASICISIAVFLLLNATSKNP